LHSPSLLFFIQHLINENYKVVNKTEQTNEEKAKGIICKIQVTNATFVFVNNWFFTSIGLL